MRTYTSKVRFSVADFNKFFANLDVPQLITESRDDLDALISVTNVLDAIRSFPSGKAAGPDSFGCEFYKAFHERIVPLMFRMVNDSEKNGKLPSTLYEANICLLLKKGKEDTNPELSSYCPVKL